MDLSRIELFLDQGWDVIGRLHQWLSHSHSASKDRQSTIELIRGLQSIWAAAEDFGLSKLARTSLAIEQNLERVCAQSLELTPDHLADLTAGVGCLQELLLSFEATRQEPELANLSVIQRIERNAVRAVFVPSPIEEDVLEQVAEEIAPEMALAVVEEVAVVPEVYAAPAVMASVSTEIATPQQTFFDRTLISMLEDFVVKIDNTCHMLHVKMLADEAPYVCSTSRLEQLSQSTRHLVEEMVQKFEQAELPATTEAIPTITDEQVAMIESQSTTIPVPYVAVALLNPPESPVEENSVVSTGTPDDATPQIHEPIVLESKPKPKRVLVVEDSLFYRQLIGMAVQSAGFEPCSVETTEEGLRCLEESAEFKAILIGSEITADFAVAMEHSRTSFGAKVIGLLASETETREALGVDERVPRSNPMQLIATLNRILKGTDEPMKMSA